MRRLLLLILLLPAPALLYAVEAADSRQPETLPVFNGKDLSNFAFELKGGGDPEKTWTVREGVIHCSGDPAGYFRTTEKFRDYTLRLEWRWPAAGGNSGVLLHIQDKDEVWPKSIEAQLQSEHAGDFWVIGGADFREHIHPESRRVPKQEKHSEKPLGEWNTYEIVCKGDTIQVYVNGVLQNVATECTISEGYIGFQSEGTPIEFRNISLEPVRG